MQKQELLGQIEPTFLKLREIIDATADHFNRPPSYGGWTPGQAVRHIQMFTGGFVQMITSEESQKRENESEKVPTIISIFLGADNKMQAPSFVMPEDKEFDADRFRSYFEDFSRELQSAAKDLDLSYVCSAYEIPGLGPMTRMEFIAFVVFHTQRHIRQLEKMIQDFNASTF